mgnify:CR=1 FL=1
MVLLFTCALAAMQHGFIPLSSKHGMDSVQLLTYFIGLLLGCTSRMLTERKLPEFCLTVACRAQGHKIVERIIRGVSVYVVDV